MKNLEFFLEKFKKLTPPDDVVRSAVARAIHEVMGVEIGKEHISLKHDTVHVNSSPAFKQEMRMKRELLLAKIAEHLSIHPPKNIR